MASLTWPFKDPNEVLDYTIDWSARLVSETILTSAWSWTPVDAVLAEETSTFTSSTTTIWLQSGVVGTKYVITNLITTSGGRTMEQSVNLKINYK